MGLAGWIRDTLWRSDRWLAELARLRTELTSSTSAERLFELATATEHCDPDRSRALALYFDAWKAGHAPSREHARRLATALGAHMTLAEIALADEDHVTAGTAYLDAGFPDLAIAPLEKHIAARPAGASVPTEALRLAGASTLLAIAKKSRLDPERAITEALALAQQTNGRAAVSAYAHAVRVARLTGQHERIAGILSAASAACGDDDDIAGLIEARMIERRDVDGLIAHHGVRFERAPSKAAYVERVRNAGVTLLAHNLQPGFGLRLVRMSLEHGYAALLPEMTAHIAAWELMWTHAIAQKSTADLVPLIVQAMAAPISADDAVYLARLGLEVAWRDAGDTLAAQPYAATLLDFVPDHPMAIAFLSELPDEIVPEAATQELPRNPAEPSPPVLPEIESRRPTADLPPVPTVLFRASSKIPAIEAAPAPSPTPSPPPPPKELPADQRPTGRLAMLKGAPPLANTPPPAPPPVVVASAPPPSSPGARRPAPGFATDKIPRLQPVAASPVLSRAKTLRRDISPIPARRAKAPTEKPLPRAARTVVPVDVVVEMPSGEFFSSVLRDVSTSGAFIVTKRSVDVGAVLSLELRVPRAGTLAASRHRVSARVARRTDVGCGLAFVDASRELVAAIAALG